MKAVLAHEQLSSANKQGAGVALSGFVLLVEGMNLEASGHENTFLTAAERSCTEYMLM